MPTECNIEYRITIGQNPVPNDADYPIKFEDNQLLAQDPFIRVIADSNLIFYGGDYLTGTYIPGAYNVEVRAWADNEQVTNYFVNVLI